MSNSKQEIEARRGKILDILNEKGKVSVSGLSNQFSVTPVTIRNDLNILEKDGKLIRRQGGAVSVTDIRGDSALPKNAKINCLDEKRAIASEIVKMIQPAATVFINSGTTTLVLAEALKAIPRLMVLTNSVAIATELSTKSSFEVVLLGGAMNVQYGFMYGGDAQEQLKKYQADWCILSADGISMNSGVTTYHPEEAAVNKIMFSKARRRIIAADHTKIGRDGFSSICEIGPDFELITDSYANPEEIENFRAHGLKVTVAELAE